MKIIISAYDCEPGRGSEAEIGWSVIHEVAKRNDVLVLTRKANKKYHDMEYEKYKKPNNIEYVYFDITIVNKMYGNVKLFRMIHYYLWQIKSYFVASKILEKQSADIVHHLTKCMDWMPSGLALLRLPFIWGPVGSEEINKRILSILSPRYKIKEMTRKLFKYFAINYDPFVRYTKSRANIILSHTAHIGSKEQRKKIVNVHQTGVHLNDRFVKKKETYNRGKQFNVIYAGELVHWKGCSYALSAFIDFSYKANDAKLVIIGDGILRGNLVERVNAHKIEDKVDFLGNIEMEDLLNELQKGEVFLYPSYHHGLATVVLQAMLTGLPVVCIEGDATGRTVGNECGITVKLNRNDNITSLLSDALFKLYKDDLYRVSLAKRSRELIKNNYTYGKIGKQYQVAYKNISKND